MKSLAAFFLTAIFFTLCFCGPARGEHELLKDYRGKVVLPEELYRTYAEFIAAVESGKQEQIEKFCLPNKIKFTTASRPQDSREYGQDINLPYLQGGFHKFILNLRKDSETEYLLRTGSTALWFIRSRDGEWKLYRYLDKPIQ